MKTECRSSFLFLFLGMVVFSTVFCFCCSSALSDTLVPTQIASKKEREVRIFLKTQRFGFYQKGQLQFWGPVCTGKEHRTPKGKFCVIEKFTNRLSYKWTRIKGKEVYMPFAVRFEGGCFLHVGEVLQRPSSDGCVRLCEEDAKRIFLLVKLKDPVIVTD